jgi:hypothetical protein
MAVVVGLLVLLGLLGFFYWEGQKNFPGKEALVKLATSADSMNGAELEVLKDVPMGSLGDWFYMRSFDAFQVPPELKPMPAVGSRTFRRGGHMVAQIAIDPHAALVYVFKGEDFGVTLPQGDDWRVFQAEGWAAAAKRTGNLHTMITFQGAEGEMRDFLNELQKKK